VFLAGLNPWIMLTDRLSSERNGRLWLRVHRTVGYLFIAVFSVTVYFMLLRLKGESDDLHLPSHKHLFFPASGYLQLFVSDRILEQKIIGQVARQPEAVGVERVEVPAAWPSHAAFEFRLGKQADFLATRE